MFLKYGVNTHGAIIAIEDVPRGRLDGIYCPYCGQSLIARKGRVKAHHFAHDGETCREASRDTDAIDLPLYDRFHLRLSGRELEALNQFAMGKELSLESQLEERGLIRFNPYKGYGGYELTHLGKIPPGQLSLKLFIGVQEKLVREQHERLQTEAYTALDTPDFLTALTDLRLYRAQWQRILSLTLYFLEITHADGLLYKIGVTSRTVDERIAEITTELRRAGLDVISITPLGTWQHRGNVELYFRHRYAAYHYAISTFKEYFQFSADMLKKVLRDLRRMPAKTLDDLECEVVEGSPAPVELGVPPKEQQLAFEDWEALQQASVAPLQGLTFDQVIANRRPKAILHHLPETGWTLTDYGIAYLQRYEPWYTHTFAAEYRARAEAKRQAKRLERRKAAIRTGMQAARDAGKHVGRPVQTPQEILQSYTTVVQALHDGLSLRQVARRTGVAVNTVRKVKQALEEIEKTV